MSYSYQIREGSIPHFLTFQVVNWVDVFSRQEYRDLFIQSLCFCTKEKALTVYAWCIMTNHVHVVFQAPDNKLSSIVRDLKSYTAKKILEHIQVENESRRTWLLLQFKYAAQRNKRAAAFQFWTHNNHAVVLETNESLDSRIDYIHNNPVKAGWVDEPEHYRYSSARDYVGLKGLVPIELP